MTTENIGNKLNRILNETKYTLFDHAELAQLTYGAFDIAAQSMQASEQEEIEVTFPVGYLPNKTAIESTRKYSKDELLKRYEFLASQQLAVNFLVQMVTVMEAMLGDVIRVVVMRHPQKLGAKRSVSMQTVLDASSIEEIHFHAADILLNELLYKSSVDFAESAKGIFTVNLLECPAFHKYIEIKASRDIYIHNRGKANDIYVRKAGTHARVQAGDTLPVDLQYFLESYESCLQTVEWLERELHQHWHSSEFEDKHTNKKLALPK
ncbi:hypothetical protein [Candidatus Electronema sp. JM]|uniref:hypothetical protein n=1 Tax=Candidatus Electronema sp. JM TaxID=3401571 RepID=UPI003AA7D0EC